MSMFRRMLMMAQAMRSVLPVPIAAWSAAGKTNKDEDRAVLKDLTGNGHDITLNGFAFSEMSGYGGYTTNFMKWTYDPTYFYCERTPTKAIITCVENMRWHNLRFMSQETLKIKFIADFDGKIGYRQEDNGDIIYENFNSNQVVQKEFIGDFNKYINIRPLSPVVGEKYTIELLPEYPDALVFDGVDDYGICENMPQVNDYTYIIKREILSSERQMTSVYGNGSYSNVLQSYMWFEHEKDNGNVSTHSFGGAIDASKRIPKLISYQTKTNYNGNTIPIKELTEYGTVFHLGGRHGYQCNMAFYSAYLFDRSLTEEEIKAFIRKNIDPDYVLPSEQETTE